MTLKLSKLILWLPCFMGVILFAVAGSAVTVVWVSEQAAPVQVSYDAPANECVAAIGPTAHTETPNDVYDVAVDLGVGMMDSRVPLVWQEVPRGLARLLGPGTTYGAKIEGQLAKRGWTKRLVQSSIDDPVRTVATRDTRYLPGGGRLDDPATAYYNRRGGYVVRNDQTGDIVQVSDRTNAAWRAPWD